MLDTVETGLEKSLEIVDNSTVYVIVTAPCDPGAVQLAVNPEVVIELAVPTVGEFDNVGEFPEVEFADVPDAFTALILA